MRDRFRKCSSYWLRVLLHGISEIKVQAFRGNF